MSSNSLDTDAPPYGASTLTTDFSSYMRQKYVTAVPSLHFSSAHGPARGAMVTRSHNPGSDVPAAVSVTQKNTFSWVRKKIRKNQKVTFMFSKEYYLGFPLYIEVNLMKI